MPSSSHQAFGYRWMTFGSPLIAGPLVVQEQDLAICREDPDRGGREDIPSRSACMGQPPAQAIGGRAVIALTATARPLLGVCRVKSCFDRILV